MTGCIPFLCTLLRAPATVMFGQSFMKPVIAVYLVSNSVGRTTIYDHLLQELFSFFEMGFFFSLLPPHT
uniref:Putative secreted protein n=1 Tax=Ixodes ricinus TaxID=34613 RepID=A0A6B0TZL2_IXORI